MTYIVRIELQRVQTFLFAVPRLADIIGANAMLGETMRYKLPNLAIEYGSLAPAILPKELSDKIETDPLNAIEPKCADNIVIDNPKMLWEKGILVRDGGHFRACFKTQEQAESFSAKAQSLLREQLPDLRFEIGLNDLDNKKDQDLSIESKPAAAIQLFSLPVLQYCEETGNGVAINTQRYNNNSSETRYIGLAAQQRKNYWQKFKKQETDDIAALMQRKLKLPSVETFEELCGDDYLALIHADGNGLGKAMQALDKKTDWLENEAHIEHFFQTMRVTLRRALEKAVNDLFADQEERQGLHILMLGGDDLLVACRAPLALDFVNKLAKALADIQKEKSAQFPALSIGAGIAIAKPAFPFHHLHDMAEELASSAKRIIRDMETPVSVVDWVTCSESSYGDLKDVRKQSQYLCYQVDNKTETLALSAKPYKILKESKNEYWSLSELLDAQSECMQSEDAKVARSQLRYLVRQMHKGRRQADLTFKNLKISSPKTWEALEKSGFTKSLWQPLEEDYWLSYFADLVELMEIPRLQTEKNA